jgi:hypothetical protein
MGLILGSMGVIRAAEVQTVEDIYRLVWAAVLGRNRVEQLRALCYHGGESDSRVEPAGSSAKWRCIALEKLSKVELIEGA